jgi:hypothetical protein
MSAFLSPILQAQLALQGQSPPSIAPAASSPLDHEFYPRRFVTQPPTHNWRPGDYAWLLTPAISQPPILVFLNGGDGARISACAVAVAPIWFGDEETLSDGSPPEGLPTIVSPRDLFANYDAAVAEQQTRCRVAVYDLLRSDAGGAANG